MGTTRNLLSADRNIKSVRLRLCVCQWIILMLCFWMVGLCWTASAQIEEKILEFKAPGRAIPEPQGPFAKEQALVALESPDNGLGIGFKNPPGAYYQAEVGGRQVPAAYSDKRAYRLRDAFDVNFDF